jgi:hypothetical protein
VPLDLDRVLIRYAGARTPDAYNGLPADSPWRISGVFQDSAGEERVLEIAFSTLEDATAFASSELGLAGTWADPDGDGNYCIVAAP